MKKITPNQITTVRLILIPVLIFFYLSSSFIACGKLIAAILFAIACLTDFLDGYIARKYNMVTNLGKFLDSIADKLLVVCALILVVADNTIVAPYGVIASCIIISREFIVSALRQIGASKNVIITADMWGKVKANFQFFAVLFFMIYAYLLQTVEMSSMVNIVVLILCYSLLGVSVIATIISGAHYLIAFKDVLIEKKPEKQIETQTPQLSPTEKEENTQATSTTNIEQDPLLPEILKLAIENEQISISMVQRRFSLGFARAAEIIDYMEQQRYITPRESGATRKILITMEEYNKLFGKNNKNKK